MAAARMSRSLLTLPFVCRKCRRKESARDYRSAMVPDDQAPPRWALTPRVGWLVVHVDGVNGLFVGEPSYDRANSDGLEICPECAQVLADFFMENPLT